MTKRKSKESYLHFTKEEIRNRNKDIILSITGERVKFTAKNDSQKELISLINKNEITICSGLAGSGKSFIALAAALNLLTDRDNFYQKIFLVKSVTTLKNEELGFLRGDLDDKLTPFMSSFNLNLNKIVSEDIINEMISKKIINYMPLAYIRGITIDNAIVIVDESQNITIENSKSFLTRIGENCKIICLGDENQIDLKNYDDSSLSVIMNILKDIDGVGVVKMNDKDSNIRNPIIPKIEEKFKKYYIEKEIDKAKQNKNGTRRG